MRPSLTLLLLAIAGIVLYLLFQSSTDRFTEVRRPLPKAPSVTPSSSWPSSPTPETTAAAMPSTDSSMDVDTPAPQTVNSRTSRSGNPVLPYTLVNGMFIVQGDVLAGAPTQEGVDTQGLVEVIPGEKWPGGVIPFHIQPDVVNPERVYQAIAMFEGSAIRFQPQQGEKDVLVFERGEQHCLSYVGKVGGKQPLYIEPRCSPTDIAHEIMHALGFVHEQNRSDRDRYVSVNFDNIEENFRFNFEKLPDAFMATSGLAPFDFESIMIYPVWMFAKPGKSTMEPLDRNQIIRPSQSLSRGDLERLHRAYH